MSLDPEMIRQLKEKAEKNRERRAKHVGNDPRRAPIVYVPAGTTLLRFYMDSENNVTRTLLRHKMRKISVPCLDGCPVCTYLSEMEERYPDLPGAWKLHSMETTIAYAWIFSCSEDNKFVKPGIPVLLMGNHKLGRQLNDHIADMEEEYLAKMLDPLVDHVLWELKYAHNNRDFGLAPSVKTGTMEPLPDTLLPLSSCIHQEGEEPTAEQVSKFIEIIDGAYGSYIGTAA